jgi:hypothetical protein
MVLDDSFKINVNTLKSVELKNEYETAVNCIVLQFNGSWKFLFYIILWYLINIIFTMAYVYVIFVAFEH